MHGGGDRAVVCVDLREVLRENLARGRHSMRRDRASPYDSKIRVVMPPQRACAPTSPAHACSASRETYAHRRRSSGASCALPEKNVITPEYRACRGVKSPSCFACASARSTSSTARRNRSGSSLATTAAVAGSRNSVHTHRVCCHRSSDTSPIGVSSIFPSWKTVGGQRVSHAPSAREVIDGASGFRVPTRGTEVRTSRIRTSKSRRAKRSSRFLCSREVLKPSKVARIVIQSCVNHSPRYLRLHGRPLRRLLRLPRLPRRLLRDRHRVPLVAFAAAAARPSASGIASATASNSGTSIRRKRERFLHALEPPPRRRRSGPVVGRRIGDHAAGESLALAVSLRPEPPAAPTQTRWISYGRARCPRSAHFSSEAAISACGTPLRPTKSGDASDAAAMCGPRRAEQFGLVLGVGVGNAQRGGHRLCFFFPSGSARPLVLALLVLASSMSLGTSVGGVGGGVGGGFVASLERPAARRTRGGASRPSPAPTRAPSAPARRAARLHR